MKELFSGWETSKNDSIELPFQKIFSFSSTQSSHHLHVSHKLINFKTVSSERAIENLGTTTHS